MRGLVAGLSSPHPMATGLPAIYQEEDPFTVRFTQAFDDSLAPIFSTLDNLPAYFDPRYAPEDFLGWLAGWIAIELDETWEVERRRAAVRNGADLLRRRGTALGLAAEIELATGGQVEIVENGGSGWSLDAGSPMIGSARPALMVRLRVADPARVDRDRLERIVDAAKPAHVPHRIEIVGAEPASSAGGAGSAAKRAKKGGAAADGGAGGSSAEAGASSEPGSAPGATDQPDDPPG
jgi:phage tail-like protein